MTTDQTLILAILALTVGMFVWGRWRHDMVALGALLACVFAGLIQPENAFGGFGHPAVVTVAAVLVLSRTLQDSGAFEAFAHRFFPASRGPAATVALLTAAVTVPSAVMNNVGALALVMPMAIRLAAKNAIPPGRVLMPLAFGSMLGGMTTLIGTPPNLIVSSFRASSGGGSFGMFDFTPVGLAVALAGVIFLVLIGWRLVPHRERIGAEEFVTGDYLTEASVPKGAKADGLSLREVEAVLDKADAQIVGFIRNDVRLSAPNPMRLVREGDILVIEAEPKSLTSALSALGLKLTEAVTADAAKGRAAQLEIEGDTEPAEKKPREESSDASLAELAVLPDSGLVGRSASGIRLRSSFGINLLAVSRQGHRSLARLRTMQLRAGDVLLMQGPAESIADFANRFGCVPLAERTLTLPDRRRALLAGAIMLLAVLAAAVELVPASISFTAAVLASMALRTIPLRKVYECIDWPLIVLLAALIPVAGAMETTGAADLVARTILGTLAQGHAAVALTVLLVLTMLLTDFMNNAATAAVMCPIALGTAQSLDVNADPFLMAVAVGSSCAFLTPLGHQNNLLIMGPGGFRFGDYWKMGLPLDLIVIAVAVPMILWVWGM